MLAVSVKGLIRIFYGKPQKLSYMVGCPEGGRIDHPDSAQACRSPRSGPCALLEGHHGAADTTVQPVIPISYYEGVQKELGVSMTDSFLRLFLLPGVGHCGGSEGPNQVDTLGPLMAWVEMHQEPRMLIAGRSAGPTLPRERGDKRVTSLPESSWRSGLHGQNPSPPNTRLLIAGLPLFSELPMNEVARIAAGCRMKSLVKGEVLFHKGDAPHGFYVVLSGQIKLAFPSSRGAEKVVDIVGPRQSFGEAPVFTERPFPVDAEALTDSTVLLVSSAVVLQLIAEDPGFARKMLAGLSMRLHSLVQDVESYSLRSSTQRVVGFLLESGSGAAGEAGDEAIELPATKQVIASRLNLTPETLSRIFHALSEAGLITVSGKHVTIHNIQRLRDHQV